MCIRDSYGGAAFWPGVGWLVAQNGYEFSTYFINPHDATDAYNFGCCNPHNLYRVASWYQASANIDPEPNITGIANSGLDFDPVDANTLYEGKTYVWKSTNRGTSWTKIGITGSASLLFVKVAPSNAQHIYAVDGNRVIWFTTNGGSSWTQGATVSGLNMLAVSPANENTLYIVATTGMYESTTGGASVTQLAGFPSVNADWVIVDPAATSTIYASLHGGGVLVSQDGGSTWQQLGNLLPPVIPSASWMAEQGGNLYFGTYGMSIWEMNTQSQPLCGQSTLTPASLTLPSASGSYQVELFIASSCSWTASSNVNWATINIYGVSSGHAIMTVTVTDNQSGSSARSGTLTIAGQSIPITQQNGTDYVSNGAVVTMQNGNGCATLNSSTETIYTSTCVSGQANQQFNLTLISGQMYFIANGSNCYNVYGDAVQIGSKVAGYACGNYGDEMFVFQPQSNGTWLLKGNDSQACLSTTSTGTTLQICSSSDTSQTFTIK